MTDLLRRGTTAFVVSGPRAGTIGLVTGRAAKAAAAGGAVYYIEVAFGPNRSLAVVDLEDVRKAPHPLGWYDRVQSGTHRCDGCADIEAAKAAGR